MSNSLRDQLVKAGLATSTQAKKAEKRQRAEELAQRRSSSSKKSHDEVPSAPNLSEELGKKPAERARKLQHDKAQRDKAAAKIHNGKYAQRALHAEIRQLVTTNDKRTKVSDDDAVPYNFVHGKKIKRIYVSKQERNLLSGGQLTIINNDGTYHFVLPEVAQKIAQRDPKRIIVSHRDAHRDETPKDSKNRSADDEYYAQFEVPDDLDW